MQIRGDGLFAWKIALDEQGLNHVADTNSATDADEDIAYALYQASLKWENKLYLDDSKKIISDIWRKEVVARGGKEYLVSGAVQANGSDLLINPSYLAPHEYKLFAKLDPKHQWNKLTNDSYDLLNTLQTQSSAGLLPNWTAIDPNGKVHSASTLVGSADTYGYDAFRVAWRMNDDKKDPRALAILKKLQEFYTSEWTTNKRIAAEYDQTGKPFSEFSDIATDAGPIIALHSLNDPLANTIYKTDISKQFNGYGLYWGQMTSYYNQNWAWFATYYLKK